MKNSVIRKASIWTAKNILGWMFIFAVLYAAMHC